jgi:hypothetical protein
VWIDTVGLHHCLDDLVERWLVLIPIHNRFLAGRKRPQLLMMQGGSYCLSDVTTSSEMLS